MNYIKESFNKLRSNWVIILPLYLSRAIPALLGVFIFAEMSGSFLDVIDTDQLIENQDMILNFQDLWDDLYGPTMEFLRLSALVTFFGVIMNVIMESATFGMIRNQLIDGEKPEFYHLFREFKKYGLKYILYRISKLALCIFFGIIFSIVSIAVIFLGSRVDEGVAVILFFLIFLAGGIAGIALHILLKLWFPAMVVRGLGVMDGLKEAFSSGKVVFWSVLGAFLVLNLLGWFMNLFVGVGVSEFLIADPILINIIPAVISVILIYVYMLIIIDQGQRREDSVKDE